MLVKQASRSVENVSSPIYPGGYAPGTNAPPPLPCQKVGRRAKLWTARLPFGLLGVVMVGLMWSLMAASAWAATWSLVARTDQGEQWFDPASVEVVAPSHVQVSSYYETPQGQRTTYRTEYDCEHQWFRDVDYDGPVGQPHWQSVANDPLNAATMVKSCQMGGYPIVPD